MAQELKPFHKTVVELLMNEFSPVSDTRRFTRSPDERLAIVTELVALIRISIIPSPPWMIDRLSEIKEKLTRSDGEWYAFDAAIEELRRRVSAETCGNG